ncbi:VOC family protein [Nonomuraea diastatica]|uniref:VOC family protein n=1 Tax=Nonomuraea diastatica TaxID=1848329 RepID=UPI001FE8D84D|nr:VOC family protein [Nonomuraea diastatica]
MVAEQQRTIVDLFMLQAEAFTVQADAAAMRRPREGVTYQTRRPKQEAEVARLLSLGAWRADTVQDEQHWVTLLDPEGNEFCVLSERKS